MGKLNNATYGSVQARRCCNHKPTDVLQAQGFEQSLADPCGFRKIVKMTTLLDGQVDDVLAFKKATKALSYHTRFSIEDFGRKCDVLQLCMEFHTICNRTAKQLLMDQHLHGHHRRYFWCDETWLRPIVDGTDSGVGEKYPSDSEGKVVNAQHSFQVDIQSADIGIHSYSCGRRVSYPGSCNALRHLGREILRSRDEDPAVFTTTEV